MNGGVTVFGGINVDLAGYAEGTALRETSTPGRVTISAGGVARNIAENLARMGCPVRLVGAVGDDPLARWVLEQTAVAGVDIGAVQHVRGISTGVYMSILSRGELELAIADTGATESMDASALGNAPGKTPGDTAFLVLDTNLSHRTLQAALDWAVERSVPVLVEPVSLEKCRRLQGLQGRIDYITPNTGEARELLQLAETPPGIPRIDNWVITRGAAGAALYRDGDDRAVLYPAESVAVKNVNGAGDAFVAAFTLGIVSGRSPEESVRMGIRAGTTTVGASTTVSPDISRLGTSDPPCDGLQQT